MLKPKEYRQLGIFSLVNFTMLQKTNQIEENKRIFFVVEQKREKKTLLPKCLYRQAMIT